MVGSKTGRSLTDARPTTSVVPSCSSNDWSPAVLVRRNGMPRNMALAKGGGDCPRDGGADLLRERPRCRRILRPAAARASIDAAARRILLETGTDDGHDARSIRRLDQAYRIARRAPERRAACARQRVARLSNGPQPGRAHPGEERAQCVEEDARCG